MEILYDIIKKYLNREDFKKLTPIFETIFNNKNVYLWITSDRYNRDKYKYMMNVPRKQYELRIKDDIIVMDPIYGKLGSKPLSQFLSPKIMKKLEYALFKIL